MTNQEYNGPTLTPSKTDRNIKLLTYANGRKFIFNGEVQCCKGHNEEMFADLYSKHFAPDSK
jgi:hypothetical protein